MHSFSVNKRRAPDEKYRWRPGQRFESDYRDHLVRTPGGATGRFLYTDSATDYMYFFPVADATVQLDCLAAVREDSKFLTGDYMLALSCDGALCYMGAKATAYMKENKMKRSCRAPYQSNQNPRAEGANRIVDEAATAMMIHAGTPSNVWAEAISAFLYTHNHAFFVEEEYKTEDGRLCKRATSRLNKMRNQFVKFDHDIFHSFGCLVYAYIKKQIRPGVAAPHKMKCIICSHMGYSMDKGAYRLQVLESRQVIEIAREFCIHNEAVYPNKSIPRTTYELTLPPLWFTPATDENFAQIQHLLDPEVDDMNQEMTEFELTKLGILPPIEEGDRGLEEGEIEERPNRYPQREIPRVPSLSNIEAEWSSENE